VSVKDALSFCETTSNHATVEMKLDSASSNLLDASATRRAENL